MILYIYLVFHDIAIRCVESFSCTQISVQHFTAILSGGLLELIFEIPFLVKIFKGKE